MCKWKTNVQDAPEKQHLLIGYVDNLNFSYMPAIKKAGKFYAEIGLSILPDPDCFYTDPIEMPPMSFRKEIINA